MNDLLGLYVAVFVVLGAGSGADKGLGLWPRIAILPSLVFGFDALVKFQTLSINKPRFSLARVLMGDLGHRDRDNHGDSQRGFFQSLGRSHCIFDSICNICRNLVGGHSNTCSD